MCVEGARGATVVVSRSPGSARPVGGEAKKSPQQLGIMSQIWGGAGGGLPLSALGRHG